MKHHSPWLDLPAVPVLLFVGCLVWPGATLGIPFSAWMLEEFFGLAFSITSFAGALWLTVLPYASPRARRVSGRDALLRHNSCNSVWMPNGRRSCEASAHSTWVALWVAPCEKPQLP